MICSGVVSGWVPNPEEINEDSDEEYSTTAPIIPTDSEDPKIRDPLSLCGDWQQIGVKCYKFIDVLTNKNDAKERCINLDSSASLFQVRSQQEQDDVLVLLRQYKRKSVPVHYEARNTKRTVHSNSSVVSNIWLGIYYYGNYDRYRPDIYKWEDNTEIQYRNWEEDSPDTSASNLCVQMNM